MSWWATRRVTVTGGRGFLGRRVTALVREQHPAELFTFSSREYDLTRQTEVARLYAEQRPDVVIHLAARVGGIGANRENPGRFFYENAIMGIELMDQARRNGVEKFVQLGTVCAYPKFSKVPFSEDAIWEGYPEETNAPYGIAKKALLVQAQAYRQQYGLNAIFLIPTNLYGPGDNFNPDSSHVIPALIRKCAEARKQKLPSITVWGSGRPTREFLYVDDAARAIVLATEHYDRPDPVNIGSAEEISIRELVDRIISETKFQGQVLWDASKPDGQPRRKLNVERAQREFGFRAMVPFAEGLRRTVEWYLASDVGDASRAA
ncbi:MAG TPA: GDP-L-fucose synthase [Candidatus Dormibacteraeota bacterium]|nr:GDP-L-fucose synthase [Candidatus Dormibacteraeota bacterium]